MKLIIVHLMFFGFILEAYGSEFDAAELKDQADKLYSQINSTSFHSSKVPLMKQVEILSSVQRDSENCEATSFQAMGKNYMLGIDPVYGACEIIDLTIPTLNHLFNSVESALLPITRLRAKDYTNWLRGKYNRVYQEINWQRSQGTWWKFNRSWVRYVPFKAHIDRGTLPAEFSLADINLRTNLKFKQSDLSVLTKAYEGLGYENIRGILDNPTEILEKLKFVLDEKENVYKVFLEGDFIPVSAPTSLIRYDIQYKFMLEKMIRNALAGMLNTAINFVPEITVQNILRVAVTETFSSIDNMYDFHAAKLENSLRRLIASGTLDRETQKHAEKGLNILFANKGDIISQIVVQIATGGSFDFDNLHKLGGSIKYNELKARKIAFTNNFSALKLKKGCDMSVYQEYFTVCENSFKDEKKLYSLISTQPILFFDLGSPVIYNYNQPSQVMMKRLATKILSVGLDLFSIPFVPAFVQNQVGGILDTIYYAGLMDEAFIIDDISQEFNSGGASFSEADVNWIFRQNLIPFHGLSIESEKKIADQTTTMMNL